MKCDRRWWLTRDGARAVEDGHPDAAMLYATPGMDIPDAEAERLGMIPKKAAPAPPKPAKPRDKP